jgi:LmbE family N-acetylglucosaminyl deacetylase
MGQVLILSPHCDDIPLSLGASLLAREWGDEVAGAIIFSESRYIIGKGWDTETATATAIRNDEERRAAALANYRADFLGLPEPGVRPGYTQVTDIFSPDRPVDSDPIWPVLRDGLDRLAREFEAAGGRVVLAPLGIGRHIDHRMVSQWLRAAAPRFERIIPGFYEDLPYAARFTSQDIRRLAPAEPGLKPVLFSRGKLEAKMKLLSVYESQLSEDDYDSVAAHWDCRGRAELVWLPEDYVLPQSGT